MEQILSFKKHLGIVVLLVYCCTIGISFGDEEQTMKTEAVTGIFLQPIENPIFYDTAVPMWFKFRFPVWDRSDYIMNETRCNSSDWFKGSSCPTTFYLPEVQKRFETFIEASQPSKLKYSYSKSPSRIKLDVNCRTVQDRFENENSGPISDQTLSQYISSFKNCSPSFVRANKDYAYDVKPVYYNMWAGFRKEVWAKLPSDRIDAGLWSNAVNSLNGLIFSNFQMEINRWKFSVDECSRGKIPGLVHPIDFLDLLEVVHTSLEEGGVYKPVIPAKCGLSCHNSLGLSSCIFADTEFAVRILVPVTTRYSRNLSLMKVTEAEFSMNGTHICTLPWDSNVNPKSSVLVDNDYNIAYNTDCVPGRLCHVPSQLFRDNINKCVSATLQTKMSTEEFVSQCPLSCKKTVSFLNSYPIVTPLSKNQFMFTGSQGQNEADVDVIITCAGRPDSFVKSVPMGSLVIKLPCGCAIHYQGFDQSANGVVTATCSPREGSDNFTPVNLTHVIPVHWIQDQEILKNFTILELDLLELNATDDLLNFGIANMTANVKEPGKFDADEETCKTSGKPDDAISSRTMGVIFGLCAILPTLLTIFLAYELRKLSEKVRLLNEPIQCQEFNTNGTHKVQGINYTTTENEYEDAEYSSIF